MLSVILTKDLDNLGRAGEVVRVKPGYGRNFLMPRGLAILATRGNIKQLEHHQRAIARQQEQVIAEYKKMAAALAKTSVAIARKAGKDDKLFGSVTSKDIVDALAQQNIELDRKLVQLPEPIKTSGAHEVAVRFNPDIVVQLKVNVVGLK
jgi:large subunit ribosomal protein L9